MRARPLDRDLEPAPIGFTAVRTQRTREIVGGEVLLGKVAQRGKGFGSVDFAATGHVGDDLHGVQHLGSKLMTRTA